MPSAYCGTRLHSRVMEAIKKTARGWAFFLFSSIKRWASFHEITNGGSTSSLQCAVHTASRSEVSDTIDDILQESAALHGIQLVVVDGLSVKSLSGHEFEVS